MNLNLPEPVGQCLSRLWDSGHAAYAVGGCVRDSLMGREPADWDVCTSATPEQTQQCFSETKCILTGVQHGTVTLLLGEMQVEVTTFRRDGGYTDHRRPDEVAFTHSLEEDLARRDFTVNAMAWSPRTGLQDPFHGQEDLATGCIRCVGDPETRFTEDALRILRMFRFSARLDFTMDPASLRGAVLCRELLRHVSGERVRAELEGILVSRKPGGTLRTMCDTGVLQQILPEFSPCIGFEQHTPYHDRTVDHHTFDAIDASPPEYPVRLALLLHDLGKPLCYSEGPDGTGHFYGHGEKSAEMARDILQRLRSDRKTADTVVTLVRMHDNITYGDNRSLKRLMSRIGEETTRQLLEVCIADTMAKETRAAAARLDRLLEARRILERIREEKQAFRVEDLAISGKDLLELGFEPGPEVGRVLNELLELVIRDGERNRRVFLRYCARQIKKHREREV